MDRRAFLRRLGAGAAAVAVAPRLLAAMAPQTTVPNGLTVSSGGASIIADDYDTWALGLIDCTTTTTVHEIRASSVASTWSARVEDAPSGQYGLGRWWERPDMGELARL